MTAVLVLAARPPWCGTCDPRTRQVELADGRVKRCPYCHPMLTAEEAGEANDAAWRAMYGSPPPRKTAPSGEAQ
jgi:hypothetical protein